MSQAADIRKKSESDLKKMLVEMQASVRDLRFRNAAKELKNHQQMRGVRKDIARILTILKEKGAKL
ncbi:MAG: 50S ribosomal protein L29 [Candidatus Doudnabacteria bacterium RIFCSPHIGHO2_01_FULL_46_14]|uniref:Large ribosomal subunit protein uL29 n=1 Tax=Candidatus Doudnabacteria bacterium RIFCSPHIGHO2_01_FULL_46_14 TaxID=1817824 RepID=A0A1F5NKP5_9BACT|nr:MAG: 50S ribosomal protein L29 [Candidatus Doudnabacteria bacterium RIFCSPHIGHO2_01_FULL_46_14]